MERSERNGINTEHGASPDSSFLSLKKMKRFIGKEKCLQIISKLYLLYFLIQPAAVSCLNMPSSLQQVATGVSSAKNEDGDK